MPNWCTNAVSFSHDDPEKVAQLAKVIEENKGIFQYLRPMPKHEEDNWYDWCCINWGTKWDARELELCDEQEQRLSCTFNTAWSPPIALYDYLQEQGWSIEATYIEQGIGFVGEYVDGYEETFDIYDDPNKLPDELKQLVIEECGIGGVVEFWGKTA